MKRKFLLSLKLKILFVFLFSLWQNESRAQYCAASNQGGTGSLIDNVDFGSISNNTSASNPTAIPYYTSFAATTTVIAGTTVPLSVTISAPGTYAGAIVSVWIDYNQDGTFAASEWQQVGTNIAGSTTGTININIPVTATFGTTGMRIRSRGAGNPNGSGDACTSMGSGETEDYTITISAATACSGIPTAGTATAPASVCPTLSYTVSLSGSTSASGLTYQWESSPVGAATWTPIAGATNAAYSTTMTGALDYHAIVTCTNGGGSDISTVATVNQSAPSSCYCTPGVTNPNASDHIINVTFAGINNTTAAGNANGYNDYTATVPAATVVQGVSYPVSMTIANGGTEYGGLWIDWDQNGTFDASEFTYMGTGANPTVLSQTINVPLGAVPGNTRMRVRSKYGTIITTADPCSAYTYGETEDYLVTVAATTACAGTPVAGTASGPSTTCANATFNLTTSGATAATGITYQWESSPAGAGTWSPIAGATNPYFTVTGGISSATDYHMVVTCANGGGVDISNVVAVGMSPFYLCYCGPATGVTLNSLALNYITNVTIPTTTLNNTTTTVAPGGYTLFYPTAANTTADLVQGVQYTINTTHAFTGYYTSAWMDWDQNGTFDAGEYVSLTTTGTSGSATFIVPLTATPGLTGMRLRLWYIAYTSGQACLANSGYEVEDYVINVVATTPCSGTPTAGTASGPAGVCPSANFSVSATGYTIGTGITLQWESSPAGAGTWTPVAGATDPIYTVTGGITSATDYQLVITCSNGGASATSNTVAVPMNSFFGCYCASGATNTADEEIYSVTVNGVNSNTFSGQGNGCTTVAPGPGSIQNRYSNFTTLGALTTVMQGSTVPFTVEENECDGATYYAFGTAIWIDFNHDGIYDNSTEKIFVENSTLAGPRNVTGSLNIPITALTGLTGMRVTCSEGNAGAALTSCLSYGYGETEDYIIDISAATGCTGTPAAGTVSGPATVCANSNFTLNASGYTVASGIDFQWESSPAGAGTWTPVAGATNISYTVTGGISAATDYHMVVTCSNGGGSATTNDVSVGMSPFYLCYCGPATGVTLNNLALNYITNVTIPTTTLNNTTTTVSPGGYTLFYPTTANTTADLVQGVQYTINTTHAFTGYYTSAWMDWDQSGTLDAGEFVNLTTTGTNGSATFTVPLTATPGLTGMRLRLWYTAYTSGQACLANSGYEVEDYVINVVATAPCSGTPTAGTASGPANACSGVGFNVSATGYTIGTGITLQWQSSPAGAGTWTPIAGATDPIYTVSSQTTATDYQLMITCANGGGTATSNIVAVSQNAPNQCYCTPGITNPNASDHIMNVTFAGINNTTAAGNTNGYNDYTSSVAAAQVTQGTSYPISMMIANGGTEYGGIWIDWDQSGTFDVSEFTSMGSGANPTVLSQTILVPGGAVAGTTRMRVRSKYGSTLAATDPCAAYTYGETEDYSVVVTAASSCPAPTGLTATNVTTTTADVSWTAAVGATGYEYAVDQTNTPAPGGSPSTTTSTAPPTVTGLTASTTYYLHVRTDCGGGSFSAWVFYSFQTAIPNNNAPGAIQITVGSPCAGAPFTTLGGTQAAGEPNASCAGTAGYNSVWYKFTAPTSGAVKISTDFTGGTMGPDSRLGLFSATDVNDYTTFSIIACDDDNGVTGSGTKSIIYAAGLTAGTDYYVQVDEYDPIGQAATSYPGTFCLEVSEISNTMLASTGTCTAGQSVGINTGYTGWNSLVNTTGQLIANVRNTGVTGGTFGVSMTKNTGAVRQASAGGQYYLDRNFLITGPATGSFDLQLFFTAAEQAALLAADPNATMGNLNVTRQAGSTCFSNYSSANGANTALLQSSNGSSNNANWLQVTTPGFSNFYIMSGANPLSIELTSISATNAGNRNRVDWTTGAEQKGDQFEVERSADGINFTRLGTVSAKGGASTYSYWDNAPVSGVNHYRLRMVEASGKFAYSQVVDATVKNGTFQVLAFPNPVTDELTVQVYGAIGGNAMISISDVTGKTVKMIEVSNGTVKVNMNGMAQGMYLVKYSDDNHSQTIKINKQ